MMMKIALLLIICIFASPYAIRSYLKEQNNLSEIMELASEEEDREHSFRVICRSKEYPFQSHKVLTEDGYWLTMFRIPGKKGESVEEAIAQKKPAIFMQHGIIDSADTFIMNDEKDSPAFMLANEGYDVWLGNTRGNKYSREHQWLDPDDSIDKFAFFNFTFDDMAKYDVVGSIDYIRSVTGKDKIGVVAHSQGTTQMYVRMTEDIEWWNSRVAIFVSLAGVAKLEHVKTELIRFFVDQEFIIDMVKNLGVVELLSSNFLQSEITGVLCSTVPQVCNLFVKMISDADTSINNKKRLGVFMAHYPAGSSLKSFIHFAQLVRSSRFCQFDYGEEGNMIEYGQTSPPDYDLSSIKGTKIVQIAGTSDKLADLEDNHWLHDQLGDNVVFYNEYNLGHLSFSIAKDTTFMDDAVEQLKKYKWD